MNQEYVILGGLLWRFLGKKITLWRNHPSGGFLAKIAVFFSDVVFCTSRFAYVAKYKKTKIMPVGVDTSIFKPDLTTGKTPNSLLFFSRISPIKKPDIFIKALAILKERKINFIAKIIGDAPERDKKYLEDVKQMVKISCLEEDVEFKKGVPSWQAPKIFNQYEIFINLTPSGSLDKMIFEAMACGSLILVSNKNLEAILPEELVKLLMFKENDAADLANKISGLINLPSEKAIIIKQQLREIVMQNHSLDRLAEKLVEQLK
jgi:glycosyltransferase involved in cell wall biosynthesis